MYKHTTFLITGAVLVFAAVTVTLYNMNVANAQSTNMTSVSAASSNPLQSSSHVTIQNTTTSVVDPLPGHQRHQLAMVLPPRADEKLWVGTVTWTASKPVELVVLHSYKNPTTADAAHGVPLIAIPPSGAVAITLIKPDQFMPPGNPVPSGTAPFCSKRCSIPYVKWSKVYCNI
jgi:hypothetical protein